MDTNNSITIEVWGGNWGLPSVDVDCLKALAYAKFNNVSFNVKTTNNPFVTPTGSLPVLKLERETFSTTEEILNKIAELKNIELSEQESKEIYPFSVWLEDSLNPALQYFWWVDEQNLNEIIRPWYCKALPFPFNYYYPAKYEKNAKKFIETMHSTEDFEETEDLIVSKAKDCVTHLSSKLGESDYFFGPVPTKFDALVFSYVAPLLKIPLRHCDLQNHVKKFNNLENFVIRILDSYFKSDEDLRLKKSQENEKNKLNSKDELMEKRKHQIYAGIFTAAAMFGFAFSKGIVQIQNNDLKINDDYYEHEDVDYFED